MVFIVLLWGIIIGSMIALQGITIGSVLYCLAVFPLLYLGMVDLKTYEIPVKCNIAIGILGIIRLFTDFSHWYEYVIGFFAVSAMFFCVYLGSEGKAMGGGDVKLMAAAGLLLGWQKIILALLLGSVAASVLHVTLMYLKGKDRVLAFGPYLVFGILTAMLFGEQIIKWYLGIFNL